jgi:anaerobic selenocysteine-containing dehydrogenase
VIDPRETYTAQKATVHLAPVVGTNIPVMNGLLNLIIQSGNLDNDFIKNSTVGFEELKKIVSKWTPEKVEKISKVPVEKLKAAATILGKCQNPGVNSIAGRVSIDAGHSSGRASE